MKIFTIIISPAIFWIIYLYYKDRFKPEPLISTGLAYIMGLATAYACHQFYSWLPLIGIPEDPSIIMESNRLLFLGYCLTIVGVLEELFKFLPFLVIIFYFKPFNEKIDGIIYASLIALGFASYENLHYLTALEGFELFGRAIASPLTHSIFSSIWGYFVGRAKLSDKSLIKPAILTLAISAFLHGMFDFLTLSPQWRLLAALIILFIWIWRIMIIEKLHRQSKS